MKHLRSFNENNSITIDSRVLLDNIYTILDGYGVVPDKKLVSKNKVNSSSDPIQIEITFPVSSESSDGKISDNNDLIEDLESVENVEYVSFNDYKYTMTITLKEGIEI